MFHFPFKILRLSSTWAANVVRRHFSTIKRKDNWESVIGLEVHAQISTASKLFSNAGTSFGSPVNSSVSLFDAAIPGTLPVLNKDCVEAAVLTAIALSCEVNPVSWFDRKHYFYADLPTGYQITQQRKAIGGRGELQFIVYNAAFHKKPYYSKCRITQLQLEQDSGKSLHVPEGNRSLIDLNRAGIPLMEIVFEPDLKDGEEAAGLVKELILILEALGTCSCRMEEGALRVDANISVNRKGEGLGTRTEVKNLGSIRSLANAIEFEVERQIREIEQGGTIVNETRGYDSVRKQTIPMRDKEVKQDYRFMPEPNLPPVKIIYDPNAPPDNNSVNIAHIRKKLKESPEAMRQGLIRAFGLKLETAMIIVNTPGFLKYFKSVMKGIDKEYGVKTANFISIELLQEMNKMNASLENCSVPPEKLGELMKLYCDRTINLNKSVDILNLLLKGDTRSPSTIVQKEGWTQVTDVKTIRSVCEEILKENPKHVTKYKANGKEKYLNQLIAKVRVKTEGKYDMKKVSEIVKELLTS